MAHSLLLIALGPVQDFIASARRTRDLWFGSFLLSELAKAAAYALANLPDARLIFPAPTDAQDLAPNSPLNVANKIVALVADPQVAADQARQSVDQRLQQLAAPVFAALAGRPDQIAQAHAQLDDLLEWYWVALPLADDEADYAAQRRRAELLLNVRKATRAFAAVAFGAPVPKSSLDGYRESVIAEAVAKYTPQPLYNQFRARPGEQLSAVDLLKRLGQSATPNDAHFPSTSHLAASPWLRQQADNLQARGAWCRYLETLQSYLPKQAFDGLHFSVPSHYALPIIERADAGLLFANRLHELVPDWETDNSPSEQVLIRTLSAELNRFFRQFDGEPSPYYALLHADGDRMGAAIDQLKTTADHRRISQALDRFARQVPTIVMEHKGACVYAGGDDVLALLPVDKVLACAHKLAEVFQNDLRSFSTDEGLSPTLSAGIAITHHLEPLSDALNLARAAEKRAKQVQGKNAVAITISKRSGSDTTIAGSWTQFYVTLTKWIELYRNDQVPEGVAFELRELALRHPISAGDPETIRQIHRHEALRILQRKRLHGQALPKDHSLLRYIRDTSTLDIPELATMLIVARELVDRPTIK